MKNVIISNNKKFEKIKNILINEGKNKLHIVTDFDRTLTQTYVNKKYIPSIIAIFREENLLNKNFSKKAKEIFNYYHKFELDNKINIKRKIKYMEEWWIKSAELLIKYKLNKKIINKLIQSKKIKLRTKTNEMIELLNKNKIPMIIISASNVGYDSIKLYLKQKKLLSNNIMIISNKFRWNNEGYAINFVKPQIHAYNKDQILIKNKKFYSKIKYRKNVILLGDSLGDINMNQNFKHDNILKIGFLNFNEKEDLKYYKKYYDVVIINDSSMKFVYDLLKEIINSEK